MSEIRAARDRRPRADAQRNIATVLDAAVDLLGRRPDAGMDEIAAAAGVARQTVYAHFRSRQALLDAVVERVTAEVVDTLGAVDLDAGTATAGLRRWLDTAWGLLERYPVLLSPVMYSTSTGAEVDAHVPITGPLLPLIGRGQRTGEFDRRPRAQWLLAATIALGHAAAGEVTAGRMTTRQAGDSYTTAVLRVFGVDPAQHRPGQDRPRNE